MAKKKKALKDKNNAKPVHHSLLLGNRVKRKKRKTHSSSLKKAAKEEIDTIKKVSLSTQIVPGLKVYLDRYSYWRRESITNIVHDALVDFFIKSPDEYFNPVPDNK